MFTLNAVTVTYDALPALDGFTLAIPPHRTTVLIGPSGSGKSTALRAMTGLVTPDAGTVTFDNIPLSPQTIGNVRRKIGYVIQDGGLFPHLSARDNVTLMARHLCWPTKQIDDRVAELARLVRLPEHALARLVGTLSGGQRQRVSLMRALLLNPDVLLLDEPLAALDPMIRYDLQQDLKTIFDTLGKTVVMVTHDLHEALFFADDVVLLRDGRIVQQGPPSTFIQSPANDFVVRFIESQRGLLPAGGP